MNEIQDFTSVCRRELARRSRLAVRPFRAGWTGDASPPGRTLLSLLALRPPRSWEATFTALTLLFRCRHVDGSRVIEKPTTSGLGFWSIASAMNAVACQEPARTAVLA